LNNCVSASGRCPIIYYYFSLRRPTSSSAAGQADRMTNGANQHIQKSRSEKALPGRLAATGVGLQHPADNKTALNISTLSSVLII